MCVSVDLNCTRGDLTLGYFVFRFMLINYSSYPYVVSPTLLGSYLWLNRISNTKRITQFGLVVPRISAFKHFDKFRVHPIILISLDLG